MDDGDSEFMVLLVVISVQNLVLILYFLSFFFVSFCVQIRVQTWLKKASISSISLIAIQVNCFYTPTNPLVLKDFRLKGEICE